MSAELLYLFVRAQRRIANLNLIVISRSEITNGVPRILLVLLLGGGQGRPRRAAGD